MLLDRLHLFLAERLGIGSGAEGAIGDVASGPSGDLGDFVVIEAAAVIGVVGAAAAAGTARAATEAAAAAAVIEAAAAAAAGTAAAAAAATATRTLASLRPLPLPVSSNGAISFLVSCLELVTAPAPGPGTSSLFGDRWSAPRAALRAGAQRPHPSLASVFLADQDVNSASRLKGGSDGPTGNRPRGAARRV